MSDPDPPDDDASADRPPLPPPPGEFPVPDRPPGHTTKRRRSVWKLVAVVSIVGPIAVAAVVRSLDERNRNEDQSEVADCATERRVVEVAVEAYVAAHGTEPRTTDDLAEYFNAPPTLYVVTDGQVYPAADSPCEDDEQFSIVDAADDPPGLGDCLAMDRGLVEFLVLGGEPGRFDAPRTVPCSDPHQAEVVWYDPHHFDGRPAPPDTFEIGRELQPRCIEALENYSGELYENSPYDTTPITADDVSWHDDPSLTCLAFVFDLATYDVIDTITSIAGPADLPARGRVLNLHFTEPGDCLAADAQLLGGGGLWARQVPCSDPHNAEVVANEFARFRGSSRLPEMSSDLEVECASHLERYTGVPFEDRAVDLLTQAPSEESWATDIRGLVCVALHLDDELADLAEVSGSIRGKPSTRSPGVPLTVATRGDVGDCFRLGDVYFRIQLWWATPIGRPVGCDEAHDGEIVAIDPTFFLGPDWPDDAESSRSFDHCVAELETFSGARFDDEPLLDVIPQPASSAEWLAGDRSLTCVAFTWNPSYTGVTTSTRSMRHG